MGRPLLNSKWSSGEAEAFARFKTPNDLAEALATMGPCEEARKAMRDIAHIKTSFADVLGSKDYVLERMSDIIWIARTESLEVDFEKLKWRLNLMSTVTLPSDSTKAHRTPEGFSTELSEIGRENLTEWYAADCDFVAWLERYR
jgi:hypothetical protein